MATKYAGQNALNKLMQLVKTALNGKADKTALDEKLDKTGGTITGSLKVDGLINASNSIDVKGDIDAEGYIHSGLAMLAPTIALNNAAEEASVSIDCSGDNAARITSLGSDGKSHYSRFAVGTPTGDNDATTKSYVDSKIAAGGVTVDDSVSSTSTNPVQNKAVKSYVDTKVSGLQTADQVQAAISSAITGVYTPKGSTAFASLPTAAAGNKGWVYNISDAFTTSAAFVEGAGHSYGAGTNVVCVDAGSGSYKWDVLAGTVDLTELTADEVQTLWNSI